MTGAIDRVKQLAPKPFNFIADPDTTVDGFLAHEAQAVVPEAVTGTHNEVDDDGNAVMQGIDLSKLVPLLTGALQEAIAKIETLETKVAALENNGNKQDRHGGNRHRRHRNGDPASRYCTEPLQYDLRHSGYCKRRWLG